MLRTNDTAMILDYTNNMAEVMLTVFALVGMLQKHFIKARQLRGLEDAKACGEVCRGRPATISPDAVRDLRQQGLGVTQIATRCEIGRASVYRPFAA